MSGLVPHFGYSKWPSARTRGHIPVCTLHIHNGTSTGDGQEGRMIMTDGLIDTLCYTVDAIYYLLSVLRVSGVLSGLNLSIVHDSVCT